MGWGSSGGKKAKTRPGTGANIQKSTDPGMASDLCGTGSWNKVTASSWTHRRDALSKRRRQKQQPVQRNGNQRSLSMAWGRETKVCKEKSHLKPVPQVGAKKKGTKKTPGNSKDEWTQFTI